MYTVFIMFQLILVSTPPSIENIKIFREKVGLSWRNPKTAKNNKKISKAKESYGKTRNN